MRKIEIDELRHLELEILDYVAKFCDEHNITYWLDFGTLIGAIRHKGYIPWDDDIDISMMRADYDRFMKLFNAEQTGKYEMRCMENDNNCGFLFGYVQNKETLIYEHNGNRHTGVKIDIFIYDNIPDDEAEAKKIFRKRDFYRKITELRTKKKKPEGNIIRRTCAYIVRLLDKIILSPFPMNYFTKKVTRILRSYESMPTKRVACFTAWHSVAINKHVFDHFIEVEFEGKKYKVPAGYDELLRAHFGDYMQLPPIEERTPKHEITAYMLKD